MSLPGIVETAIAVKIAKKVNNPIFGIYFTSLKTFFKQIKASKENI